MLYRKGAYFYVIDAFIASIVIIGALVVLFSQFTSSSTSRQAYHTAEDFLATLTSTAVRNVDDTKVREWITNGTISNPQLSVLQQIGLFKAAGDTASASYLTSIMAAQTTRNVGVEVLINNQQIYLKQATAQADADNLLSARRILLTRKDATTMYPPSIIEVKTWQ